MPELCRFYGIVIRMYFADHGPPHFHASYGGDEALVSIDNLAVSTDAFHIVPETSLLNGLRYTKRNFEKPGTEPAI